MLQQRQIVKISGKQIDIEDPVCTKYAIASFHCIGLLISVNVTIYRTMAPPDGYEINHYIITTKLRSCI
jgi:hypothetical protein